MDIVARTRAEHILKNSRASQRASNRAAVVRYCCDGGGSSSSSSSISDDERDSSAVDITWRRSGLAVRLACLHARVTSEHLPCCTTTHDVVAGGGLPSTSSDFKHLHTRRTCLVVSCAARYRHRRQLHAR